MSELVKAELCVFGPLVFGFVLVQFWRRDYHNKLSDAVWRRIFKQNRK